ncbi:MAG: cytochrome b/b6 domain-containing protein [Kofleriaceae bacterium]|nr:cytochrome b/b6 domain-containing protein [Candidatus Methylomirabilis lanthanidiphila]
MITRSVRCGKAAGALFLAWLCLTIVPNAVVAFTEPSSVPEECLTCHNDPDLKKETGKERRTSLFVEPSDLAQSPHKTLTCAACHADISEGPHTEIPQPVRCNTCHRKSHEQILESAHAKLGGSGPSANCVACHGSHRIRKITAAVDVICAACHGSQAKQMAVGIHAEVRGEPARSLPTCVTCHAAHTVRSRRDPASSTHRSQIHEICARCHADPKVIAKERIARPRVVALFEQSIHGQAILQKGNLAAATCTDCHGAHEIRRGADPASGIFKGNVAATCSRCHANEAAQFQDSVHGGAVSRGISAAPTCTDCHGEHGITGTRAPGSRVAPLTISKTCAACHEAAPVVEEFGLAPGRAGTFFESFHGLAVRGGSPVVANCASCHGTHNIRPSADPRSTVNPMNLSQTCGQCHGGAGMQLAAARIHVAPGFGEHPWVTLIRRIYLVMIVIVIGGMSLHNALDFLARLRERWRAEERETGRFRVPSEVAHRLFERFTLNERIQHVTLLVTFTILVLSGFALKFPDAWWVRPLVWIEKGYAVRAWLHRIAGAMMTVAAVYHLAYLFWTQRGRTQFRLMRPCRRDISQAWDMVAFNLGWRPHRPRFHRFTYAEKLEYWAVVWGTVVMAGTGFIMWFQTGVLTRWPLAVIDLATVVHYYEAWLATLAVLVWHFYSVIFRPDVYPMSPVWLTGRLTGEQMAQDHAAELEEMLAAESAPSPVSPDEMTELRDGPDRGSDG